MYHVTGQGVWESSVNQTMPTRLSQRETSASCRHSVMGEWAALKIASKWMHANLVHVMMSQHAAAKTKGSHDAAPPLTAWGQREHVNGTFAYP